MRKWLIAGTAAVLAFLLSGCAAVALGLAASRPMVPKLFDPVVVGAAPGVRPTPQTTAPLAPAPVTTPATPEATTANPEATTASPNATAPSRPQLEPYTVVDDLAGVLTPAQKAEIEAAFADTAMRTGIHLFIVYVDSFDGLDGVGAANQFAMDKYLTEEDVLLAVAIQDQMYGVSYVAIPGVTEGTAWELAMDDLEIAFVGSLSQAAAAPSAQADWSEAAIAAANALTEALGSGPSQTT